MEPNCWTRDWWGASYRRVIQLRRRMNQIPIWADDGLWSGPKITSDRTWNGDALHIRTRMDLTSHHLSGVLLVPPQIMRVWLLPWLVEVLLRNAWRYFFTPARTADPILQHAQVGVTLRFTIRPWCWCSRRRSADSISLPKTTCSHYTVLR